MHLQTFFPLNTWSLATLFIWVYQTYLFTKGRVAINSRITCLPVSIFSQNLTSSYHCSLKALSIPANILWFNNHGLGVLGMTSMVWQVLNFIYNCWKLCMLIWTSSSSNLHCISLRKYPSLWNINSFLSLKWQVWWAILLNNAHKIIMFHHMTFINKYYQWLGCPVVSCAVTLNSVSLMSIKHYSKWIVSTS